VNEAGILTGGKSSVVMPDRNLGLITHKNVALKQAMYVQWESRCIAILFL
jgi:hypothetical protein